MKVWATSEQQFGSIALVILAIAIGAALRVNGALIAGQIADVSMYRDHVEVLRQGGSVYRQAWVYPYFPGWLQIEWACWTMSETLRIPFWLTIRLIIIVADVFTCFALWWTAARIFGAAHGRQVAALYALSPIAIAISGYHGQFESLPTLLSILALGLLARPSNAPVVGALLGLATAIKPFPAVAIPVFARSPGFSSPQRRGFVVAAGVVLVAVIVLGAGSEALLAIQSVLGYSGGNDQGLGGLLRGLWLYRANNLFLPGDFGESLSKNTRWLALALMSLTWLLTWRLSVARSTAAILLAFLAVYGGISTQYLLWPVTWLLLSDISPIWSAVYSVGVTAGAVGYYLLYWPGIILGAAGNGPPRSAYALTYVEGEIVSWGTILVLLGITIGRPTRTSRTWHILVGVAAIVVAVTAVPVVSQVAWLAGEWVKWQR